jgi:DNA polymerase I-like protein with 3'-5' exonuclease and polymerase domains
VESDSATSPGDLAICQDETVHEVPVTLDVDLAELRQELACSELVVFDFETSGVKPRVAVVAGIGFYFPASRRVFYINCNHGLHDPDIPRYPEKKVAAAIRPFFRNPARHAVAHNATFDVRMLYRMGIDVRCRVCCTMVLTHRLDENLRSFGSGQTTHYHLPAVTYGLKELTQVFFRRRPPTLHDVIGERNTLNAPPRLVADYCRIDVVNTYNLFSRFHAVLGVGNPLNPSPRDWLRRYLDPVYRLASEIDDPNNLVLARMMWEGVGIDAAEAARQRERYRRSIQACREEIWRTLGTRWPLETPANVLRVMRSLGVDADLGFDPFAAYPDASVDWRVSVASEVLLDVYESVSDPFKQLVIALLLSMSHMKQRLSAFLDTLPAKARYSDDRLYPDRFDSTLVTTRFSSSPNLQNLPGKADKEEVWQKSLPDTYKEYSRTRNLFIARPGSVLVSIDLKAAEPRYMALLFQRALGTRNEEYLEKRRRARRQRQERYPALMAAMRRLQNKTLTEPFEVEWPSITDDPLWRVFKHGVPTDDPYNALLIAMDPAGYQQAVAQGCEKKWLKDNRDRGKKAFLAFAYGASAATLAPQLGWSLAQTEQAIRNIETSYPTLIPLRQLTLLEMVHLGQVENLWGRPRRINGYYQLARPEPVTVHFRLQRPTPRSYIARIIPLGSTSPALSRSGSLAGGGVQAFVEQCYIELDDGVRGEVVLAGNPDGTLAYAARNDPFVRAPHFNKPPFRNISFSLIQWVEDGDGLRRLFPRQAHAWRMAFNSLCQATGADHLRWIMNAVDREVCLKPRFRDCKLVLTVHDSLVYELPEEKLTRFVKAARPVACHQPPWADIDFKVEVEWGRRFGEMKELP